MDDYLREESTKVQPNKLHSMAQVPMTLTCGQGQSFPKMGKNQRTGHISEAISPTDFILSTKVQPNKAHSMTQVPMTLTFGQGQIFPKMGKKIKELCLWSRSKVKVKIFPKIG